MIAAFLLAAALQHWLVINDIHLNPFSTEGVVRGDDTTPALWKLAVPEMRRAVPDARVVILGGDMLAHHFATLAVDARESAEPAALGVNATIARDLGTAFPNAKFLIAQGNNDDDPCGDYRTETGGPYQRGLARIWQPLVDRDKAAPDFVAQFMRGGYYTARLPIQHGEAIVLNSVFWSIVYRGGCGPRARNPGQRELAWLDDQLNTLPKGANAAVLMHIPPGYDPNATMLTRRFLAVPFLAPHYGSALVNELGKHADEVRAIYGAHTHRYDFRVVGGIPMFIASSISPIYNNNPAFFVVTVDANGAIADIQPYAYDLFARTWQREPSFDRMYGVPAFTMPALTAIAARIQTSPPTRAVWKDAFDLWSWRVGDLDGDWRPFACAQTELGSGYAACAHTLRRTLSVEVLAACVVALAVVLVYTIARRRNARQGG